MRSFDLHSTRRCLLLLMLTGLALGTAALDVMAGQESPVEPVRLRVLSYNIHHGEGVDRKLDLNRIAAVIKSVEPDLVALQEVDKRVRRSQQVDQPAELAKLTGLHVVFGGNIRLQDGEYGNAVFSRVPARRHENHPLRSFDGGEQRGVLAVELEFPAGKQNQRLLLLATHLDHRADGRERVASVKAINELASKTLDRPALLAGDLNDELDSEPLKELKSLWTPASDKAMPTVPVARPVRQIDFICFRPRERWKVLEVRVLEENKASDHRAIFAVLELRGAPDRIPAGRDH